MAVPTDSNVPALTVVSPVKLLTPVRESLPVPFFLSMPVPEICPEYVVLPAWRASRLLVVDIFPEPLKPPLEFALISIVFALNSALTATPPSE